MSYTFLCFLVGGRNTFPVDIEQTKLVSHLKQEIKKIAHIRLDQVAAPDLTLYKVEVDGSHKPTYLRQLDEKSKTLDPLSELNDAEELSAVFPEGPLEMKIQILVQPPDDDQADDSSPSVGGGLLPYVTFNLLSRRSWHAADLVNNKIALFPMTTGTEPNYITKFKQRLTRKRLIMNIGAVELLAPHVKITDYFEVESQLPTGADASNDMSATLQKVTDTEVSHYFHILQQSMLDLHAFKRNKEAYVHSLLFQLDYHVHRIDQSRSAYLKFGGLWDFLLIGVLPDGLRCKYTPKSDASLHINTFPHLVLEVYDPAQSDRKRMLLQTAYLTRVGNMLRKEPVIISTIYIDDELCATWYLMYQPLASDTAVKYVEKIFDLKKAKSMFEFVFQLYNFVSLANEDSETLPDSSAMVAKLYSDVDAMGLPTLTARTAQKRKHDGDGAGNEQSKKPRNEGGAVENEILSDGAILAALKRTSYTIPDDVDDVLLPLTTKMHLAVSQKKHVILKLTDQHEVEVLQRLHGNQSRKPTRIVPLLDVIDGRLIVLPLRTPLLHFLHFDAVVDDVGPLALQFLEGVSYMQHCSVAHLDLKPDNIVVQRDPNSKEVDLNIIDFNIAVFADAEPTTSASSGSPGWCAPEVSAGIPYDPLLADLWSCGRVLKFFTERMKKSQMQEWMRSSSQKLMNPNPSLRPSVTDLAEEMRAMLKPSIRPASRPGGVSRPRQVKPRSRQVKPRSSRGAKGLGLQARTSSPVVGGPPINCAAESEV